MPSLPVMASCPCRQPPLQRRLAASAVPVRQLGPHQAHRLGPRPGPSRASSSTSSRRWSATVRASRRTMLRRLPRSSLGARLRRARAARPRARRHGQRARSSSRGLAGRWRGAFLRRRTRRGRTRSAHGPRHPQGRRRGDLAANASATFRGALHHYGPASAGWLITTGQVLSGAREEAATPNAAPRSTLFDFRSLALQAARGQRRRGDQDALPGRDSRSRAARDDAGDDNLCFGGHGGGVVASRVHRVPCARLQAWWEAPSPMADGPAKAQIPRSAASSPVRHAGQKLKMHAPMPAANATLHVTPGALGTPWTFEITNTDDTPLRLVTDGYRRSISLGLTTTTTTTATHDAHPNKHHRSPGPLQLSRARFDRRPTATGSAFFRPTIRTSRCSTLGCTASTRTTPGRSRPAPSWWLTSGGRRRPAARAPPRSSPTRPSTAVNASA